MPNVDFTQLHQDIKRWAQEFGFQRIGVADIDLKLDSERYRHWCEQGFHGTMNYMTRHESLRNNPQQLVSDVQRVIVVSMNYLSAQTDMQAVEDGQETAYIARYALGRDYHKLLRKRLDKLAQRITHQVASHGYRAFCDSAPVLERALARKAGIGWVGKNTMIMNREQGSWFFLGELFTNIPLPIDQPIKDHCGSCSACITVCPTQAIIKPYQLDARRCIAYLTIEHKGSIDPEFRPLIGNRVFGCDDCQIICPWNKFAKITNETDFKPRHQLNSSQLVDLFLWDEATFLKNTEGSAIRRTGYVCWLRNIAIGLGNAAKDEKILAALNQRRSHPSSLVREHVEWAIAQQQ